MVHTVVIFMLDIGAIFSFSYRNEIKQQDQQQQTNTKTTLMQCMVNALSIRYGSSETPDI